jgi:hypothetical protein
MLRKAALGSVVRQADAASSRKRVTVGQRLSM